MNKYGKLAKGHWEQTDPARYHAIADPTTFFSELGEQAETQIQDLAMRLSGDDPPGEEYLQKVGRLNMARLQAEEVVLRELVWISEPQTEDEEQLPDRLGDALREIWKGDQEDQDLLG